MYMDKEVKRGYNEYIRLEDGIGRDAMMDVATPTLLRRGKRSWPCWFLTASAR